MSAWLNIHKIDWCEPLLLAERYAGGAMALLYSGLPEGAGGTTSYLFVEPIEVHEGTDWHSLPDFRQGSCGPYPDYVGYLGYEMEHRSAATAQAHCVMPGFRLVRYRHMFVFDHLARELFYASRDGSGLPPFCPATATGADWKVVGLSSNFTKAHYLSAVADTLSRIKAGDFYQANITRKFWGKIAPDISSFALFRALCSASPAPYSAYIRHEDSVILSSSPECFLRVDAAGTITTRPIKGSARRGMDSAEDARIHEALRASEKNRAENLMIVDLMRNDLARVCAPQSVEVTERAGLYSYATIHHLVSTITGRLQPGAIVAEAISACFPPGSMTGAPKRAAMQWCAQTEAMARGVYSGAIGWISENSCDLSVVIRTLILRGTQFEFQVGGGIVADSSPEEEWRETLTKARGIAQALGISEAALMAL